MALFNLHHYTSTIVGLAEAIGKTVLSVANNTAVVQTKRFRGTNVHNKIRNAIELGGSLYAVK